MLIRYFKFYAPDDADGGNKPDAESEKNDETKQDNTGLVDSDQLHEQGFDQIERNLEAARNAVLEVENKDNAEDNTDAESNIKNEDESGTEETDKDKTGTDPVLNQQGLVEVTEDYITKNAKENFPELNQELLTKILEGIKGDQMSPRAFKNYVHTQHKIRSDAEAAESIQTKDEATLKKETENYVLTNEENQEVEDYRTGALYDKLKSKYPDLTTEILADRAKLNEYISDLDVNRKLDAIELVDDLKTARAEVNSEIKDYVYKAKNWNVIARSEMTKQVDRFKEFLKTNGLKPEDVGADLSEQWIVKNLMKTKDNDLNPKVMAYYRNDPRIPVVLPDSIVSALKDIYVPKMLTVAQKNGISLRKNLEPNPSMSSSKIRGGTSKPKNDGKIEVFDDSLSIEDMDKNLEEQKKLIVSESEN